MKALDKRSKAKGRYFMSGEQMRHAKWQESHMNSVAKRRGIEKPVIDHYVCSCGCGTVARIKNYNWDSEEVKVAKKRKKIVAREISSGQKRKWVVTGETLSGRETKYIRNNNVLL